MVYQWHREGFELPHGANLLAEGDIFQVQAMRYGPAAYGIQFHAEVTHAMMCRWTTRGYARMELPGAKKRDAHFAERPVYDVAIRKWLATFLQAWLAADNAAADAAVACSAAAASS
jgi:GMP synthase (glutamine-hydrolysing)